MVVDELGLVRENELLVCYVPATNRALVWRVKARVNAYPVLNYGPLPFTAGELLATYEGGSTAVPADGVLPARSYNSTGKSFPLRGAIDETDMWYLTDDYRERVFHVIQKVTPSFVRVDVQIPKNVVQGRFQRDKVVTGVDTDFGFTRGVYETVHLHKVHYGYRYGNDTNLSVYTNVKFVYGEYLIETPRDPELIFAVLTKKVPSHWVSLPINVWDVTIERAMLDAYGILGFTVYGAHQRSEAIEEYRRLLREVRV